MSTLLNSPIRFLMAVLCLCSPPLLLGNYEVVRLASSTNDAQVRFAISEIAEALDGANLKTSIGVSGEADIQIIIQPGSAGIEPEGFVLSREKNGQVKILATDPAGAMYGGIELAEQIRVHGLEGVTGTAVNPYMQLRGTKFNIPLDVRTPSYTDPCDAAQKNIAEMWNYEFWTEYIDSLARYRYNFISLWSLHPFPSMVKVAGYEDVALDDVRRSKVEWDEYYHPWAVGLDTPEIVDNFEVLKKITIDEKIDFWTRVMAYAKSRNVTFYVITWNIFVNGTEGKYGITDKIDNPVTRDYFRESIKAMFRTYPDLGGIGLTTGENMHGIAFEEKEDWAFDTYAKAVLEVAREMPDRKFTLIHRQHMSGAREIAEKFRPVLDQENIEFIFSFKYAKAHVLSATRQPYHEKFEQEIGDLKTIWTLRNDDVYYFRWGGPDFVREFVRNIPHEISRGMYYGSDQWIWGREFTMRDVPEPRQLEVVKHWYHWLLWGSLTYNPDTSNARYMGLLQDRFPEVDARILFDAWQEASMIYPVTTGFHWGTIDLRWYIEGCRSRPNFAGTETGFHDVNTFIHYPVHDYSGAITIPDFVKLTVNGETPSLRTPLEVSALIHQHADKALSLLKELESAGNSQELQYTLNDIATIATLGQYYAHKISGSTYVALYRETKDRQYQEKAVAELTSALNSWKSYAEKAMAQNLNPVWTNRVGHVDWVKTTEWVKADIDIALEE